ncbi:uncharacterized protein FIESC28_07934 [Fusarium coffeatum]|uniref:Uncharacterized protein n=1 Tax=Fusarium coffeatum TaxID=231269 RepID=A0A366RBN0_9HYPO|nr:uncharacterized protein FIESC28_07934 [Fusarium coffeatum]RBR13968.1 hypothetical protein FIESC28_07934 [Fusarium coffeatum]
MTGKKKQNSKTKHARPAKLQPRKKAHTTSDKSPSPEHPEFDLRRDFRETKLNENRLRKVSSSPYLRPKFCEQPSCKEKKKARDDKRDYGRKYKKKIANNCKTYESLDIRTAAQFIEPAPESTLDWVEDWSALKTPLPGPLEEEEDAWYTRTRIISYIVLHTFRGVRD